MWLTKVINIIMGGPDCDKSLFTEAIIRHLKLHHKTVEQIPDVAKPLVWQKDYEALKNRYPIARQQFRMIELLDGQLSYLVTECSLPQILYDCEHHPDNICDIQKTKAQIQAWCKQHNNVNVMVERGDKKTSTPGAFRTRNRRGRWTGACAPFCAAKGLPSRR